MSKSRYPGIERLSGGRYRLRMKTVDPKTGKAKDIRRVINAASIAEAVLLREKMRNELLAGGPTATGRIRLREFATSWMRGKLPTIKPSSADKYATILDRHVLPALGDYYVDAIEPADVLRWRDAQRGKPRSINSRLQLLRTMLRDAQIHLNLPRDPTGRVQALPIPQTGEDTNRLTPDELTRVLFYLRDREPNWYPLFLTLALTGARFGEASALRWDDLDEDNGILWIRRSHWKGRVGTTKTGKIRDVPLSEPLRIALNEHRQRLLREQAPGLSDGWMFPSSVGTLQLAVTLRKPLNRALVAAGIERRFTVHGFRRTWNNLLRQVTSAEITRSMTGHDTEAMFRHYSHIERHEKQAAVDRVLALVGGTASGTSGGTFDE